MLRAVACKGWQAKAGWHVGGMLRAKAGVAR